MVRRRTIAMPAKTVAVILGIRCHAALNHAMALQRPSSRLAEPSGLCLAAEICLAMDRGADTCWW